MTLFDCCSRNFDRLIQHFTNTINNKLNEGVILCKIGSQTYRKDAIVDDFSTLLRLVQSRWFCVQEAVINTNNLAISDVQSAREFINESFIAITESLVLNKTRQIENDNEDMLKMINILTKFIVKAAKINEKVLIKVKLSRQESCAFYQYSHTLFEFYYYTMLIYFLCGAKYENIAKYLENVMSNMFLIYKAGLKDYESFETCNCTIYFWLTMQLITEKVDPLNNLFWNVFNNVLQKDEPLISLSLLRKLASVQTYNSDFVNVSVKCERIKPNYHFLELKFRELVTQVTSNCDVLLISLRLIEPLLCNVWLKEGKIDILQIIWDFYSKRLNVSNQNINNFSALGLIETLDRVLYHPKDCTEDFEFFVGLLLYHLKEYPMNWRKIKGRIYSQLGPNKVKDLSEIGIRHVMILFLALSSIHFEDTEKKMLVFLDNLPTEKKFTILVWNMYAAMILKYVREDHSIEHIATPLLNMLREASANQKLFHLIKDFMKNLEDIVNHSASMRLHQWLLFGPWLGKYQSVCYFPDLTHSLNVILLLLEKCTTADSWSFWENLFEENVYVNLKRLASNSNPSPLVGKIAGKLALCYNTLTNDAFSFFNSDAISPKIASAFLEVILENYPDSLIMTPQQENLILQSWVNICFLTESQRDLTKNVVKLDIFLPVLKNHLKNSNDPMEAFIEYLGSHSKPFPMQINDDVLKLSDLAFGNLDKTLSQYLLNPDNEQIVTRIYKYVALLFLNCGYLVYNRHKPVTILTKLVQRLLLPMDFLIGKKTLHNFILNAIKRTWALFLESFINLNSMKDPYLERTLKDMVVKYLPYFPTSDSPIVDGLDNPKLAEVILDKISLSYFKPQIMESDANLLKALKIISDFTNTTVSLEFFTLVVDKTLYGLFEVVIFHPQRSNAISVIKHITNSHLFPQVKQKFKELVLGIAEKHMGLNTINFFQLMICLAKFVPEDMKEMLHDIRTLVGEVERLRGVGFDKSLRLHLEKLENCLQGSR